MFRQVLQWTATSDRQIVRAVSRKHNIEMSHNVQVRQFFVGQSVSLYPRAKRLALNEVWLNVASCTDFDICCQNRCKERIINLTVATMSYKWKIVFYVHGRSRVFLEAKCRR